MSMLLFQKQSLTAMAAVLDVHPFDIARLYGQEAQGLPKELRFSAVERSEIASKLGLESWWTEKKKGSHHDLLLGLVQKLWRKGLDTPTRGDNLYRGLEGDDFQFLRSVVNAMIRIDVLTSTSGPFGIMVSKGPQFDVVLKSILDTGQLPAELQSLIS